MPSARILFVDDEESIRLTLPPVLKEKGFEVAVAASVADALVEINTVKFNVLIADLNLAEEGDGFLVISAMRHIQPHCVNLILTGYPALETALHAIHTQVDDYLTKPTDLNVAPSILVFMILVVDRSWWAKMALVTADPERLAPVRSA